MSHLSSSSRIFLEIAPSHVTHSVPFSVSSSCDVPVLQKLRESSTIVALSTLKETFRHYVHLRTIFILNAQDSVHDAVSLRPFSSPSAARNLQGLVDDVL